MARLSMIKAPWTDEQVVLLQRFQRGDAKWHPFTCPCEHLSPEVLLHATNDGWECESPVCHYTQDWAYEFMLKGGVVAKYLVRAQRTESVIFEVSVSDEVTATGQVLQEAINDPQNQFTVEMVGKARPTAWLPINMEKQA